MPSQNLNSYYYSKYRSKLNYDQYFDLTLASDEKDYDEEVVFSNDIIAANDGNRLPISMDLSSSDSSPQLFVNFYDYSEGSTLVSKNYYNPYNLDLSCYSAFTGTCDVGLTATDNGLFKNMTGETLYYTMGIRDDYKFDRNYRDRRFKMTLVTGYTQQPNIRFSGIPKNTIYNIVSKSEPNVGYYQDLYGGFYQGFYKLFGYDYEVFPERVNKGWTVEMLLKPRQIDEYSIDSGTEEYLNDIYPGNSGTFFFFGTRSENKYYHFADGTPESDSGYTRLTSGLTSLETCACSDTGITNSNCVKIYPQSASTPTHNIGCGCGQPACTENVPLPPTDPKFDVLSSAMSIRLNNCAVNPNICVKYIKITGDCVTTGTCETSGITFQTGYTITEICSPPIYDICEYDCNGLTEDRWLMISAVFERYTTLEDCDLLNLGGLGDLRNVTYQSSIDGMSYKLISPPETHPDSVREDKVYRVNFNNKWFDDAWYRMGRLKLYVNGYLFMVIENFEEIIPRELNTEKEKQIGVPFNISFGGGTQGLHNHLIFSSDTTTYGPYIQDPELFPNNILSATTLSGLTTDILMEQNFGGTFMGGVSQFRMYVEPLSTPQVQHNFRILKDKFNLFNFWCPNCFDFTSLPTSLTPFNLGRVHITDSRDNNYLIEDKLTIPKTVTTSKYWDDNSWWGNQGNTPMCVGYAWAHWVEDGPTTHISNIHPVIAPTTIYKEAQKLDEWVGENYNGTSVRGAAKYLKNINAIDSYLWTYDVNVLSNTVLNVGPVVVGTNWYDGMFYPDKTGLIKISGRVAGGHAYVINGVDTIKKQFRIKNSWGKTWGIGGHAYISFTDMSRLIKENGEICLAVEKKF